MELELKEQELEPEFLEEEENEVPSILVEE